MIEIIIDMKLYHLYRIFIANYKMSDIFNTIGRHDDVTCKQTNAGKLYTPYKTPN